MHGKTLERPKNSSHSAVDEVALTPANEDLEMSEKSPMKIRVPRLGGRQIILNSSEKEDRTVDSNKKQHLSASVED